MATRSRIGIANEDGTVTSIYCHFDGYPENNGKILTKYWTDVTKLKQLMALGDVSVLGKEIGEKQDFDNRTNKDWCLAYGRDRGEDGVDATEHHSVPYFLYNGEEYNYLFQDGKWICFAGKRIKDQINLNEYVGA